LLQPVELRLCLIVIVVQLMLLLASVMKAAVRRVRMVMQ